MSSNFKCRQVDKYDGQCIYAGGKIVYELGNYLGGGASGSVYQACDPTWLGTDKGVAVKILNPLGYKNIVFGQINQCTVLLKGSPLSAEPAQGKLQSENIWWMMHPTSKVIFAAFEDPHRMQLRELPLTKCVEIWGMNPLNVEQLNEGEVEKMNVSNVSVTVSNKSIKLPLVSPKYLKFLKSRQQVCREMSNMSQVGEHPNIIDLLEVLELIQESKTTIFLVLELINGGELFERMKSGVHTNAEEFARRYFTQLISGLEYCHKKGVVHRDLKPENLLLSDPTDSAILKIADFGLSAVVFAAESNALQATPDKEHPPLPLHGPPRAPGKAHTSSKLQSKAQLPSPVTPMRQTSGTMAGEITTPASLKRLRSVVGSPHYIAPEIGLDDPAGYDGRKVDMWSAGIILYSMFTASLPFGSDLTCCPRFKRYKQWINTEYIHAMRDGKEIVVPSWFWPVSTSPAVGSLLVGLLHYEPAMRLTASEVMRHPWFLGHSHVSLAALPLTRQPSLEATAIVRTSSNTSNTSQGSSHRGKSSQTAPDAFVLSRNMESMEGSSAALRAQYTAQDCAIARLLQGVSLGSTEQQDILGHMDIPRPNQHERLSMLEQQRQKEAAAAAVDALPLLPYPTAGTYARPPAMTHQQLQTDSDAEHDRGSPVVNAQANNSEQSNNDQI